MSEKDIRLDRRTLLHATAASAAAVAAGGGCAEPYLRQPYPDVPENRVELKRNGRRVLIVGAGLSGLITACELLDRGYDVTILEKNATAGGRLRSWRDRSFGQVSAKPNWPGHPIEHGTHIVLDFYNNFREFLGRHGLRLRERTINDPYAPIIVAYPDGSLDERPISTLPAPFHAIPLLRDIRRVPPEKQSRVGPAQARSLLAFDSSDPRQIEWLDSITLAQWAEHVGLPREVLDAFFDPLMDMANFHPSDRTSALYLHRFAGAMMGDWRDLYHVQFFQDSTDDTIIQPLADYVRRKGGRIVFNADVEAFIPEGDAIGAVQTRVIPEGQFICPVCGEIHEEMPERCRRCGYSGGGFRTAAAGGERYEADYFLLGIDIPSAQKLFAQEPFASNPFFDSTQSLPTSSIVVVYLWYPRPADAVGVKSRWADLYEGRECLMTGGFPFLGTTLNLTILKAESFGEFDADVIETQIARVERVRAMTDAEIAARIDADLRALIPGLPPFTDFRVMRWDNFSTMTVGAERNRPDMVTPFRNFLILGDYTKLDHNCILMEKVTVNARRAINRLLDLTGQTEGRMTILPSETPNPVVSATRRWVGPGRLTRAASTNLPTKS